VTLGAAQAWAAAGASISFAIQNDRFLPALRSLTADWPAQPRAIVHCDVQDQTEMTAAFEQLAGFGNTLDAVAHCVAHAPKSALTPALSTVSRDDFTSTMNVSVHSLLDISRRCKPLLSKQASIVTMSFIGANQVIPQYGVMGPAKACLEATVKYLAVEFAAHGTRVNCISSGPVSTLAARGIPGFTDLAATAAQQQPLKRPLSTADIGSVATFLASDAAAAITGQTVFGACVGRWLWDGELGAKNRVLSCAVDNGYHLFSTL
jgi:enoyl-[acyl-carrier protein] reductase I